MGEIKLEKYDILEFKNLFILMITKDFEINSIKNYI